MQKKKHYLDQQQEHTHLDKYMAYSLTSLVDKVRQALGGAVAQAPTTLSDIGNRISSNANWAGQRVQQNIVQPVQQAFNSPQAKAFGNLISPMNQINEIKAGAEGVNRQMIQPTLNLVKQGLPSAVKLGSYIAPGGRSIADSVTRIAQSQGSPSMNFLNEPIRGSDFINTAGLTSVGKIVPNMVGGYIGSAFKAGENVLNKQPITTDIGKAYDQGFNFTAQLGPVEKFTSWVASPVVQKLTQASPIIDKVVKTLTPQEVTGFKTWITESLKQGNKSGMSMSVFGALQDAKNPQEALKNVWDQYKMGFMFGGASNAAANVIPGLVKPSINLGKNTAKALNEALPAPTAAEIRARQGGFVNIKATPDVVTGNPSTSSATIDVAKATDEISNSLKNNGSSEKPGALERAKADIQSGKIIPIRTRVVDGKTIIEDGRHRLQAASELGMKTFPVEDVTNEYTGKPVDPLVAEAKKYTSAEDFVKAQKGFFRGEYSKEFEKYIKQNKDGIPTTLGGNDGIPTSKDFSYVNKRFVGSNGELGVYIPKGDIKVLIDPIEIARMAGKKSPSDVYYSGKVPAFERGRLYKNAKEAGYDAVDLTKIEKIARETAPPNVHYFGSPEQEVRIINRDAFVLKTKSQLTDIWNQAQSSKVEPIGKVSENPQALTKPLETQQTQPRTIQDQSPSVAKPGGALVVESSPYFNTDRLNISDKAKSTVSLAIEDVKPQIEAKVGKKLTNKEVVEVANNTASVLNKSVSRAETAAWEAKMLKARQQLAKQATDGTVTEDFINNLIAIKSQGTDIARKLQSLSIGAAPGEVTAKQAILEAVMKVTDNVDEIVAKSKGVDFNDYEQASQFYRQFVKPKAKDWVDMVRYSSMLSSPNTHINNFSSNAQGTGIVAPIEKTIAGGVDWLLSAINPARERTRFAGEGVAYSKGYASKLGDAWTNFKDTLSGKKMSSMQELHNIPLTAKGTVGRSVENTLSYPGKLLQAADEFFQTLTSGGVESQLKYREGKGMKVRDIQGQAYLEARKRLFNSEFGLKEDGPLLKALEFIPMKVAEARASSNPVISTVAKYTFPFVKIPSNLLKASVEYSPAGLATIPGAGDKITQLSKAMLGTAIGLSTATLVAGDRMTWAEPADPKKKELFKAAGMQPYSIKIGDSWYSYSKLHPAISFNLALVSAVRDAEKNQLLNSSQADTLLEGAAKWVNFYADQSYVKNIGDMVSATKGDAEAITRSLSNYPQQLVPFRALLGWVARMVDPYQRKVDPDGTILEKQIQQLMTQIPGLSQSVPARMGPGDVPIENQNRIFNAFSPVRATNEVPENKALYNESVQKSKDTKQKNADKKQTYENSSDAPQGILDRAALYATALPTDPENAIKALFTQEVARKMRGNALILERKIGINTERDGLIRDHLVPLGIGGDNADSNIVAQTKEAAKSKDVLENKLIKQLENGEITKEEATAQIKKWAENNVAPDAQTTTKNEPTMKVGRKKKITSVDELKSIEPIRLTGNTELDKRITSEYNTKIAAQGRDIMALYDAGKLSVAEAGNMLDALKAKKLSTKKLSTKGIGKVKVGRRMTIKMGKVPKVKSIKIKRFTPKKIVSKPLRLGKMRVRLS